ncbi:hypothetical protein CHU92_03340 [Flavobacterium cyanobacteriorum]|uniref:Coproporphyrinogen III oxidase n=1 Tax=Flavobacterium cyanobacteriorum TaxID=2022802 RepID=A0A255ZPX4_9FLAO|nr:hypothetical protein [Flavobacterium cyanobacteriorum]OYQ43506.1 hypothetical protein CHU92_03340 [Flavobacterium cyanobacteriorum]
MKTIAKIVLILITVVSFSCANANKAGSTETENTPTADTIPPVSQDIPGTDTDTLANPDEETVKP